MGAIKKMFSIVSDAPDDENDLIKELMNDFVEDAINSPEIESKLLTFSNQVTRENFKNLIVEIAKEFRKFVVENQVDSIKDKIKELALKKLNKPLSTLANGLLSELKFYEKIISITASELDIYMAIDSWQKYNGGVAFECVLPTNENVYDGDVTLTTQQEVDDFGVNNYTEITGYLKLGNGTNYNDINDISSLSSIQNIEEYFFIQGTSLQSLTGLENLNNIGGIFYLNDNNDLVDINALFNLTQVRSILIKYQDNLTSLSGLDNSVTNGGINGRVEIENNDSLTDYCGITSFTNSINDSTKYSVSMNEFNPSYQNILDGYCSNRIYNGSVTLATQQEVNDFGAIGYTSIINGGLTIDGQNSTINNLSSLNTLTSIESTLDITNTSITSLNGLQNIDNLGASLGLVNNPNLNDISAFNNLNDNNLISLSIRDCPSLSNIEFLTNISEISGYLEIRNTNISSLEHLQNISYIGWNLDIVNNNSLINIDGLSNISSVGFHLLIINNSSLTNINGLNNLISVGGVGGSNPNEHFLSIYNNDSLTSLDALDNLNSITGDLVISENDNISDLCGLQGVISNVGGNIDISNNAYNPTQQDIIDGNCSQ